MVRRRIAVAIAVLATATMGLGAASSATAADHYENQPRRDYVCQQSTVNTVGGGGGTVCGWVTTCHWHFKKKHLWSKNKEWLCS